MITQIENCTLIYGDCYDYFKDNNHVDCIITDPPYEFNTSGAGKFRRQRHLMSKISDNDLDKGFDISSIPHSNSIMIFCHNDQIHKLIPEISPRYDRYAFCFWKKTNPMPVANKHYRPDIEIYIHAWNKGYHPLGDLALKSRVWTGPNGKDKNINHPTVKPINLMDKILQNANCENVIDPFMGSGTTGISAAKSGKKFIGIEKNKEYYDIAVNRIRDHFRQATFSF